MAAPSCVLGWVAMLSCTIIQCACWCVVLCTCVCVGGVHTATWHLSPLHCKGVGMNCMEVCTESPSKHILPLHSCTFWVWIKEQGIHSYSETRYCSFGSDMLKP